MAEGEQPDDSQKTEEPTAKKLEEARKKGQVPLSREVNNWMMLLIGTILIMMSADGLFSGMAGYMKVYIERAHDIPTGAGGVKAALGNGFIETLKLVALPLLLLMFIAFISPFVQIGPLFTTETITPNMDKISPMKGIERLFSQRSIVEFLKGVFKIILIGAVGAIILYPYFGQIEHMIGLPMLLLLDELQALSVKLMIGILIALAVLAAIDLVFQRQEHYKKMRMTKQELKDEYKQTEGDPHVRARLRSLRAERARQRMIQNVPQADVVITNPTHYSIALKYTPGEMEAPKCIAKGVDEVALRIREVAKEHGIIIYENVPLARALYDVVEIDEIIPEDQYKAVAEVISFVFKRKGKPTPRKV